VSGKEGKSEGGEICAVKLFWPKKCLWPRFCPRFRWKELEREEKERKGGEAL